MGKTQMPATSVAMLSISEKQTSKERGKQRTTKNEVKLKNSTLGLLQKKLTMNPGGKGVGRKGGRGETTRKNISRY